MLEEPGYSICSTSYNIIQPRAPISIGNIKISGISYNNTTDFQKRNRTG